MILQPPAPVTDDVRRVMSDGAYDYSPSLPDRILERIGDFLDGLVGPTFGGAGGAFGGGVGGVLAWLLILAAVVAVVVVVVVVLRSRVRRERPERDDAQVEVEHRRPAGEWASEAAAHEAAGRWAEAVRARYRELVRTLVDRRQLPDVPGLTTRELRVELAGTTPTASVPFDEASTVFELAWYALVPTGPEDLARLRRSAAEALAAPREVALVGVAAGAGADG